MCLSNVKIRGRCVATSAFPPPGSDAPETSMSKSNRGKHSMNRKMIIAAASALMLAGTQFAAAATDGTTASFDVTAAVQAQCAVGNTQTLALGNLTMIDTTNVAQAAAGDTQTATFDAICTNGTASPVFKFDSANNAAGVFNMASGANLVKYSLYQGASTSATQIASGTASAYDGF